VRPLKNNQAAVSTTVADKKCIRKMRAFRAKSASKWYACPSWQRAQALVGGVLLALLLNDPKMEPDRFKFSLQGLRAKNEMDLRWLAA
jgi:hypothetical protein